MTQLHSRPGSTHKLHAYAVALELGAAVQPLLPALGRFERDAASQVKRAVASVAQNIAEAQRRTGADRAYHLGVALGSAAEVRAALEIAAALGALAMGDIARAVTLADRVCAMVYRLRQRIG